MPSMGSLMLRAPAGRVSKHARHPMQPRVRHRLQFPNRRDRRLDGDTVDEVLPALHGFGA